MVYRKRAVYSATGGAMASSGPRAPRPWGQRPSSSLLEAEGEYRLERESRSWGGERGAPWGSHEWDEPGGPQWPPGTEDRGSYAVSNLESRGRQCLPPRGNGEEASWGAINRGPQELPWESWSSDMGGMRGGSWEPPQKRLRSPPMEEWLRAPLSSPGGRGSISPSYQRQPGGPSSLATHWTPLSITSRRDSPGNGGPPWVLDGPAMDSMGWSCESPVPTKTWESCHDSETMPPASGQAMEGRDWERPRWPEEPGSRSSGDPAWEARQGNPVDGSYSVKAGGSRGSWSGNGVQSFQCQADLRKDSREWGHGGPRGLQDEGRPVWFPRESLPPQSQGTKTSFQGNFLGLKDCPERDEGLGTQAETTGMRFPHPEVVGYWAGCQSLLTKRDRNDFLSFCPMPVTPQGPSKPPILNAWIRKHIRITPHLLITQQEVMEMLVPTMALYEMAEAALERQGRVDPLVVRQLARALLSLAGSTNRRLTLQRCSEVLEAIDPRLRAVTSSMTGQNLGGLLFAEDSVNVLKGVMLSFPELLEEPAERDFGHCQEATRPPLLLSPLEFAPPLQDGAAPFYEHYSDQRGQNQEEASMELWHRRFGHAHPNLIVQLQNDKLATGIKVDPGEAESTVRCLTCLTEKGSMPPSALNAVGSSAALLDLIHCELSGPYEVPSLLLQRYILIFVDDFSGFCVTNLLKDTGEMHGFFEMYLAMLRKNRNSKPKAFQMNSAANAVSPQTRVFLDAQGIAHKRGLGSIPGKSRTAEKEMKSLLGMTRCMLDDAELPHPFWGHALLTATYLWNRLPCAGKRSTPFQDWYGRAPNVKHLRVFGSQVHLCKEPNSPQKNIFVCYGGCKTGYRVMNLETGVVFFKRTLAFDERKGVQKGGKYLDAIERLDYDVEGLVGTGMAMTTGAIHNASRR